MKLAILIFFVAVLQDLLVTTWTRAVAIRAVRTACTLSFVTSVIAVTLYGKVANLDNALLHILAWALGSTIGTYLSMRYEDTWRMWSDKLLVGKANATEEA